MSRFRRVSRASMALVALPVLAGAAAAAGIGVSSPFTRATGSPQAGSQTAGVAGAAGTVGTVAGAGTRGASAGSSTAATSTGWHVLTGHVIPNLASAQQLSTLPQGQRIQVGVALANPNAGAMEAAARAVYTPGSPSFHHFYTPAQWQQRFSVSKASFSAISSELTSQGLKVVYAAPTRDYVTLGGTVGQVERTFSVSLDNYSASGQHFFANTTAPTVPNGVNAVLGLESLSRQLPTRHLPQGTSNAGGPCVQGNCIGILGPKDLWSIYDMPSTNRGQGQKVAVIGEGDMAQPVTDLRTWEGRFSLPQVPVKEIAVGDDQTDTSGLLEWNIDTQATTGMAPDAQELDLYFVQNLGVTTGAFSVWANDANGPLQANASFGGCESINLALGSVQAEQPIFAQAAAEGRSLFVSTGDTGGSCSAVVNLNGVANTVVPQVEWPAASNWAVAVGGTELFASSGASPHRVVEKAWESTGGGSSVSQPAQPWQTVINVIQGRCVVDGDLAPQAAPVCRGLPDVTAMSGDILFNQYDITSAGANNFGAGTSLASPLWAGIWTRIQAAAPAAGNGFAAASLYQMGNNPTTDVNDFFDVIVGTNGQYTALPRNPADPNGWDFVSGLGAPDVAHLMSDITGALVPSNTGAPIGGGGATSSSASSCGPNGTMDQPGGNEPFAFAPASVTKVVPSYSSGTTAVTVTWTAPKMSSAQGVNELDFYYIFTYATKEYELDASYDPVMGNSFLLYNIDPSTGVATQIGSGAANGLSGGFDFVGDTAAITMTVAGFNGAASPSTALGGGKTLTTTQAASGFEYTGYSNFINPADCSFTLM